MTEGIYPLEWLVDGGEICHISRGPSWDAVTIVEVSISGFWDVVNDEPKDTLIGKAPLLLPPLPSFLSFLPSPYKILRASGSSNTST